MDDAANPGGAGWSGGGQGGWSGTGGVVDELDELWPERRTPSAAALVAKIWAANPETSERWTYDDSGVDSDPEIWEVRIHFEGLDNLERKIDRDDVTCLNIIALIETQGYGIRDSVYCRLGEILELVNSNAKIYELLDHFEQEKVLNLTVKRGRAAVSKKSTNFEQEKPPPPPSTVRSIINYADPVACDLEPPPVYVVNDEGSVFSSQCGSVASQSQPFRNICTQESNNVPVHKGKAVQLNEEEDSDDVGLGDEDNEFYFDMGEADFAAMAAMRSKEDLEMAQRIEERRKVREDPLMHCEGDTDIEVCV